MLSPGVQLKNMPDQVTSLIPPGSPPAGTRNALPSRNTLPERPDDGTLVAHAPVTKSVVARTRFGSNVMAAEGTGTMNGVPLAVNMIGIGANPIVVGCCGSSPLTLRTPLNQM